MAERPILMSAPMVRACLREVDPKTQTRRVLKPQPEKACRAMEGLRLWSLWVGGEHIVRQCPYGVPGDVLWVKETHRFDIAYDTLRPRDIDTHAAIWYEADGAVIGGGVPGKKRVSLHMQRRFSRLSLRITDVRVERLNEISEADAAAEGLLSFPVDGYEEPNWHWEPQPDPAKGYGSASDAYSDLWEHINGPGSWDENPFVWAVSFERV